MPTKFNLQINGKSVSVDAEPDAHLLTVLRDELDLTGTKYGCGEGQCGACTVMIDGLAARSCQTWAAAGPAYRSALDRRSFFKTLGGGIVVVSFLAKARAQESGRGRGRANATREHVPANPQRKEKRLRISC